MAKGQAQRPALTLEELEKRGRMIRKLDADGETDDANDAEYTLFADALAAIAMGAANPTQLAAAAMRARGGAR